MYIVSKDGHFVREDTIKVLSRDRLLLQILGDYETHEMAMAVLNDLVIHIQQGGVYRMPDDERARFCCEGCNQRTITRLLATVKRQSAAADLKGARGVHQTKTMR